MSAGQLKISKQLENEIANETDFETMRQKLHEAAASQPNVRLASNWDSPVEPVNTARYSRDEDPYAAAPARDPVTGKFVSTKTADEQRDDRVFSKTIKVNGRDFTVEGNSAEELERRVAQTYEVANALAESQPEVEQRHELSPADRAELEIRFRNGSLSAKEYLEKTGAIAEYLKKQGVPVDELKSALDEDRESKVTQSWADATQEFLNSDAGSSWPGGEPNKNLIALTLQNLGLLDASDKVGALAQAYAEMQRSGMIFAGPAEEEAEREKQTEVQVQQALENATPQEILEAYKQGLGVEQNVPKADDAFVRQHSRSGSGIFGR